MLDRIPRELPRGSGPGRLLYAAFLVCASLGWGQFAVAHEAEPNFPVIEQVSYVLDCMDANGGQNIETLYTCSCRAERLDQAIRFDDYEEAQVYKRFKNMPGERGGLFRESDVGKAKAEELDALLAKVEKACPLVQRSRVQRKQPSEQAP